MRLKVTKNKFGELSSSPIFEDGKVIFPSFANPHLAKEGEVWEAELLKLVPLNKVDKKGQPMFKGIFRLIPPTIPEDTWEVRYDPYYPEPLPYEIVHTHYYKNGGVVERTTTSYFFGSEERMAKLPAEIKEKFKNEIAHYKTAEQVHKIEFSKTNKIKDFYPIGYKIDVAEKELIVSYIKKYYLERRETFLKSFATGETITEISLQTSPDQEQGEIRVKVNLIPKKRKVYKTEFDAEGPLYVNSMVNHIGRNVWNGYHIYVTQYGYEWQRIEDLPKFTKNPYEYNLNNGYFVIQEIIDKYKEFRPSRNTPKVDKLEILSVEDWNEVLEVLPEITETKTTPETAPEEQIKK